MWCSIIHDPFSRSHMVSSSWGDATTLKSLCISSPLTGLMGLVYAACHDSGPRGNITMLFPIFPVNGNNSLILAASKTVGWPSSFHWEYLTTKGTQAGKIIPIPLTFTTHVMIDRWLLTFKTSLSFLPWTVAWALKPSRNSLTKMFKSLFFSLEVLAWHKSFIFMCCRQQLPYALPFPHALLISFSLTRLIYMLVVQVMQISQCCFYLIKRK